MPYKWRFHHIDLIARPEDRELVADMWRKLGGETVSYEVVARRPISLLTSSASTLSNPQAALVSSVSNKDEL